MPLRLTAFIALAALAGCTWDSRPDGASAVHSASDGYYESEAAPQTTPLGGGGDAEVVEPLGDEITPPVELTQPPTTADTPDATSEVD